MEEATTHVIEEKLIFDGSHCWNTSTCSYVIPEVLGGEVLRVTLTAENVAGNSSAWTWEERWETLPFGLMNVTYEDSMGVSTAESEITLSWEGPPPSTGFGNSFDPDMPILQYHLEVSRCDDFNVSDPSCESSETAIVLPNHTVFVYPDVYPFEYVLKAQNTLLPVYEGLFYYFRVTAENRLGKSNTSDVLSHLFGDVACPRDIRCAVCGDGEWMPGREECEDGNIVDGDGCDSQCKIEGKERKARACNACRG